MVATVLAMKKTCGSCKEEKSTSEFYRRTKSVDGLQNHCKNCTRIATNRHRHLDQERHRAYMREWYYKTIHHITVEIYEKLLEDQGGVCAICKKPPLGDESKNRHLHVDHDHQTGTTRGLLCPSCNTGIGLFNDDIDCLVAAIAYLTKDGG